MLIAFNFPEAEYNKLYSIVNKILLKNEISNKVQWPHISLLEIPDVKEEDKKEIQERLRNKPTFRVHGFDVFEGRDRDYLVITLDTPKEYKEAFSYLNNKFKTNKEIRTPHVSLLSVPKKDNEVLLKLMPKISKQTINTMPEQVKPNYIQFWRKADPTMVIDHDPGEDKSFEVFDVMESQFELSELEEKTLYHGTNETFLKFKLMPARTGQAWGKGVYLTNKGVEASKYAGGGEDAQVHILDIDTDKLKLANIHDPDVLEYIADRNGIDLEAEFGNKPMHLGNLADSILEYSPEDFTDKDDVMNSIRKALMNKGYDGLYLPIDSDLEKAYPTLGDNYVIYKPELVKHLYVKEDIESSVKEMQDIVDYLFRDEPKKDYTIAKEGGVIVNYKLTPTAYKAKKALTLHMKNIEIASSKVLIDMRKEKENDISHIFALQYPEKLWKQQVLFPEMSTKIVHIGAFKDKSCAMNYLNNKTLKENINEDWAHEVGQVKAELGEIEEIYKDFDAIYNRILDIEDVLDKEHITKLIKSMERIRLNLIRAENGFRSITNSAKAPNRNPIKHSTPIADPKKEMQRISTDIAKLSVRVRNIGQSVDDFENVPTSDVAETFEKASEALRKIFVQFEKLIPESVVLNTNTLEEAKKSTLDLTNFADALKWAEKNVKDAFDASEDYIEGIIHERIQDYIYKYKQVMSKPTVTLYRAIVLKKDMSNLNLKNIGSHWSFEEKGAGSYGLNRAMRKDETEFTFTGVAQTKDIDWEYGFTSFLYYGEEQWECALNPGAKVTLTHVDKKALPKTMVGVVGSKLMGEDFKNTNDLKEEKEDTDLTIKKVIKGKLPASDDWSFVKSYNIADKSLHGDSNPEICANCGKSINHVVVLDSPEHNDVHVGADCAEALTSGKTKEQIEKFIKDEKQISNLTKNTYKKLMKRLDFYKNQSSKELPANFKKIETKDEQEVKNAIRKGFIDGAYYDDATAIDHVNGKTLFDFLESTNSGKIIAYHGGNSPINKFDKNFSAQGVFWFSDNKDKILRGESGAASTKYLMTVELNVKNPAGWKEYERDSLDRIEQDGFDSIKLDDDWVVFDSKKIKVIKAEKVEDLKESKERTFDEIEINKLMDLVLKYREIKDNDNYFLRLDKAGISNGTVLPRSRVWDDGEPTDELLNGTSCIGSKYRNPKSYNSYHAEEAYLVSGDSSEDGNDVGERVVKNCTVISSLKNGLPDELEEAKKKLKKIKKMLAPFYGRGNGVSGATIPPFRTNMSNTKLGPSLPGPTGQNAPQFGTLPAGPTAPMVSSKDWDEVADKLLREWNNNK